MSIQEELKTIHKNHLYRTLRPIDSAQDALIQSNGKSLLNFSSNNYLGLANDPRLKSAAIEAIELYGTGSGASRLITGSMSLHHQLEEKLAQFKGTTSALVFNSGYHANLSVISALMREGDVIYSDELNHASIIDGCRLSRAQVKVYRHSELTHLEEILRETAPAQSGIRRLIVTDSIFSMDGDRAPLAELARLAEHYDCWLMVDEAHATGVIGPSGKGLVEEVWPNQRPAYLQERLIQMGTLGKALGSFGAYVAGSQELVEFLINRARPFIYTTALPPSVLAASFKAIEIVEQEPERRERLWENVREFLKSSRYFQKSLGESWELSPILPLIIGDSQKTLKLSQHLFEKGFWVGAIRYPTVPPKTERLRITLMATHTKDQIRQLMENLNELL